MTHAIITQVLLDGVINLNVFFIEMMMVGLMSGSVQVDTLVNLYSTYCIVFIIR